MIDNAYRTGNLPPTSSENQPPDEPLSVDNHEILLHVSSATRRSPELAAE
jgi:hypothetical protein